MSADTACTWKDRSLRIANRIIQWCSLAFLGEWAFYGIFRCPFVVPFVSCQNCPILTCPGRAAHTFWGVWGVWLGFLLLLGRGFCGWLCPGGLVNRILAKSPTSRDLHPGAVHDFSLWKYICLAMVILAYFVMNQPRTNIPIRIGEFWPAVYQTFLNASDLWLFRTGIVLLVFALGLLVAMAWCRFICPMGGLLELLKRFSLFRFYKDANCNNCDLCRKACYMHTRPEESNCTNCGDCLSACPRHCIKFGTRVK